MRCKVCGQDCAYLAVHIPSAPMNGVSGLCTFLSSARSKVANRTATRAAPFHTSGGTGASAVHRYSRVLLSNVSARML